MAFVRHDLDCNIDLAVQYKTESNNPKNARLVKNEVIMVSPVPFADAFSMLNCGAHARENY